MTGLRLGVDSTVDVADAVSALREAGATVVDTTDVDQFAAVAAGDADIAIVTTAVQGAVGITPTVGVIGTGETAAGDFASDVTLLASTVDLADAAMAVLAAGARSRPWPADTRLAAPPTPVVAIPDELPHLDQQSRADFDAAVDAFMRTGVRIITVAIAPFLAAADVPRVGTQAVAPMNVMGEADALLLPTATVHLETYTSFDMCGVAVPARTAGEAQFGVTVLARAFDDAVALDIAARLAADPAPTHAWPLAAAEYTELVVFGAHLRGGPLAHQLTDRGARFAGEITTAPRYRMTALPTVPPKPGVTRVADGAGGAALTGHRWLMSPAALGRFLAELPAPMQLGKVEFADGTWRTAFGCDGSVEGVDVSHYGSWPAALAAGAVPQT